MMQSPFAIAAGISPIQGRMSDVSSSMLASPQFGIHVHSNSGNMSSGTAQYATHVNSNASNNIAELSADGKYTSLYIPYIAQIRMCLVCSSLNAVLN
jgi:hypothetical protein